MHIPMHQSKLIFCKHFLTKGAEQRNPTTKESIDQWRILLIQYHALHESWIYHQFVIHSKLSLLINPKIIIISRNNPFLFKITQCLLEHFEKYESWLLIGSLQRSVNNWPFTICVSFNCFKKRPVFLLIFVMKAESGPN